MYYRNTKVKKKYTKKKQCDSDQEVYMDKLERQMSETSLNYNTRETLFTVCITNREDLENIFTSSR